MLVYHRAHCLLMGKIRQRDTGDSNYSHNVLKFISDGTVPLISLGYLCNQGWTSSDRYNPSRISVITKEYHHLNISAKGVHADQTLATDDSITSVENIISDFSELMTSSVNEIKEIITEKTFSPITHWSDRFRGGMESAEHSDILGHPSVITDVLYLAAGLGDRVNQNQVFSKIKQVASGVSLNFRD